MGCLQGIPGPDNFYVETGDLEVGELRPTPFHELGAALGAEARLSLATLALAELGMWPEFSKPVARRLADLVKDASSAGDVDLPSPKMASADDAGVALALKVLPALRASTAQAPAGSSRADWEGAWELLRLLASSALCRHPLAEKATESWLRRIVPYALEVPPEKAVEITLESLKISVGKPVPWMFETGLYQGPEWTHVGTVAQSLRGRWIDVLAGLGPYRIQDRVLQTQIQPYQTLDTYRVRMLFQSYYLEQSGADREQGSFDRAACLDMVTGLMHVVDAL